VHLLQADFKMHVAGCNIFFDDTRFVACVNQ
jgi:hypothetical protein